MPLGHLDLSKEYRGTDRNYLYSRALDVHKWSDYPEVNTFVNHIYDNYFLTPSRKINQRIAKKHIKVVLLDLYVAWNQDPQFHIGVHLSEQAYSNGQVSLRGRNRYNETHIKRSIIDVIHRLVDVDIINFKAGINFPNVSYTTRIWASTKLIKMFEDAKFGEFDIHYLGEDKKRECIILKDADKNLIPDYDESKNVLEMRKVLQDYNALLEKTFIDIGSAEHPYIDIPPHEKGYYDRNNNWIENKPTRVSITQDGKFTTRVFNNSSWEDGGRFYGGFWQRVGSAYRERILINNMTTNEVDYSALHVVLAYAQKDIDYWSRTTEDPYDIPILGINDPEISRKIVKLFFLVLFNSPTEKKAFRAFRNEWNYSEYKTRFDDEKLSEVLKQIRQRHPDISDLICTGAGVELQYIDSQILEYIIKDFVSTDTPILCVHDSLVVPFGEDDRLEKIMKEAFYEVTGKKYITLKFNNNITKTGWLTSQYLDRNFYLDMLQNIRNPATSDGYKRRMERHNRYFRTE